MGKVGVEYQKFILSGSVKWMISPNKHLMTIKIFRINKSLYLGSIAIYQKDTTVLKPFMSL